MYNYINNNIKKIKIKDKKVKIFNLINLFIKLF